LAKVNLEYGTEDKVAVSAVGQKYYKYVVFEHNYYFSKFGLTYPFITTLVLAVILVC